MHAVAGIGDPERFFETLRGAGIAVVPHAFADHHRYVAEDLRRMTMLWASRRPMGMTVMPDAAMRAGDRLRLAWLLGRAEIAGVGPAGVYG